MNLEMKSKIQNAFVLLALAGLMGLAVAVQAQTIQPIYSFTDGTYPYAALTLGPDGNFYGTTLEGSSNPLGTVFQVTTDGELTTLVNFVGANGATPQPSLTLGPDGNFYGTTAHGGSRDQGTVFRVTTDGALTTLVDFVGANGGYPLAALTLGPDGNFYGTTYEGGSGLGGTVFQVTTDGALRTLVRFAESSARGAYPYAALTLGPDGNFYGTTSEGGRSDLGTVFRVTTGGALTTLVSFDGYDKGAYPYAALTLGPDGNFYGTTTSRGSVGEGTVFRVTTGGAFTTLVNFDGTNGAWPEQPLTLGPDGSFYGTTSFGGSAYVRSFTGDGTVFRVTTNGAFTTLANFGGTNGRYPSALTLGPDGNFYGTAQESGSGGGGEIYRLNLPPTISQIIHSADGGLTLDLVSTRNVSSRLYAATNLSPPFVWQPIATNLDGGAWRFTDTNTAGFPVKLYRVSTP